VPTPMITADRRRIDVICSPSGCVRAIRPC
jgi:hypothetical protein